MNRFCCPACWKDFNQHLPACPYCCLNIRKLWDSKDHSERLMRPLRHPEPSTPIRSAEAKSSGRVDVQG